MRFQFVFLVLALSALTLTVGCGPQAEELRTEDAEGHAAVEAEEHAEEEHGLNPLVVDPDLAIFTAVIFLVLLAVLWKFAWGPISEGLDRREHAVAENIAAAERAHEDAKRLLAEYQQRLAASQDEVRAILDEARRDAEHTQQEILAKARAEADVERQRALRDIETATVQAEKRLAELSANLAVDLAAKIVRQRLDPSVHAELIEDALARLPQPAATTS